MKNNIHILKHQILEVLYKTNTFTLGIPRIVPLTNSGNPSPQPPGWIPSRPERDYTSCKQYYGNLVNILNRPKDYLKIIKQNRSGGYPFGDPLADCDIDKSKYSYQIVNIALEVLIENNHITEENGVDARGQRTMNIIALRKEGALAYQLGFYCKELNENLSIERKYAIEKKELRMKKNLFLIEAFKYFLAGIGSAIATLVVQKIIA